ncbi:MAG: VOC family protein [Oscillospiraceae bacterium]|nr:VOC family protein [Oscillospiraceae bacterium]
MKLQVEMFINFNGNCREAVEFYAKAFNSEVKNLMTYGDAPPDPNYTVPEADKGRIMYAGIPYGGITIMFMDYPSDSQIEIGGNIHPSISVDSKDEVTRLFNELKTGGEVQVELAPMFFSEWYGMVKDKFGVTWHILYYSRPQ